jgi:N-acetyl-gamma-glutamyl-phosphate reductase common form
MGGEAVRILLEHPGAEIAWLTSRNDRSVEYYHKNLLGAGLRFIRPEDITPCDVIFSALPSGQIMTQAGALVERGTKLIDLGADFRLKDRPVWERVYRMTHYDWSLAEEAVYGIPELHREEIKKARLVANPGCFSSAAILGLAPLVKNNIIDVSKLIVDGLSGTAGAGAETDKALHHPEMGSNLLPYNVVGHRHTYEIEQELGLLGSSPVCAHFTTTYVPITRGILDICHCFPTVKRTRGELLELYQAFYQDEPFVKIIDLPYEPGASWQYMPYPWVSAVSGTNYCHIGLDVDASRGRIVVFSVLDSIGKGGAHAAVQNMNLMFGLEETTGLKRYGLHPY